MPDPAETLVWTQPGWLGPAHAWIALSLENLGIPASGPIEQVHARPWSTVLRTPTAGGFVFFKASIPLLVREPALTQMLYSRRPDCTLPVLAADLARGWMLVPDGGPLLRSFLKTPDDLRRVDQLLPSFAELQIELTGHLEELLPRVPFDRRMDRLPGRFEQLLADRTALQVGQATQGLSENQMLRLQRLLPRFREMCAQLAAAPIPPTLHHDDFHDANIFGGWDDHLVISDWAESCVTHPFFSMLIFLRSVASRVGLPDEATDIPEALPPLLTRLRDMYLEPWQRFDTHKNLVAIFNTAWRVGMVNRALTWQEVVSGLDPAHQPRYRYAAPAWLGEFLTLMERSASW
jgi:hypothetical protein